MVPASADQFQDSSNRRSTHNSILDRVFPWDQRRDGLEQRWGVREEKPHAEACAE